ncbi:MAG: amidophosphoribosyltransferase [bacterium]|nr:amidophosphoribosyltransferase [bacterium]
MSGIIGIFGTPDAAELTWLGTYGGLQHRGKNGAGICSSDGQAFHFRRGQGCIFDVITHPELTSLPGHAAIGQVGRGQAEPRVAELEKGAIAAVCNGKFTNAAELRKSLEQTGAIFETNSDVELLMYLVARSKGQDMIELLRSALSQVEGAYCLLLFTHDSLFAIRDPRGFYPLVIGRLSKEEGDIWVIASETCALDIIGAKTMEEGAEVKPGEVVKVDHFGLKRQELIPEKGLAMCTYERVYSTRPDSSIFGVPANKIRENLGRRLAAEHPVVDADFVVPVPDSGTPAAIGYAEALDKPFRQGLIRNHYVGSIHIDPSQRDLALRTKYNPTTIVDGKVIVLVDDSLLLGQTARVLIDMLKKTGAKEVHVRISCPPTISTCYYGTDLPRTSELIAINRNVSQIRDTIGADSLGFLSMNGLRMVVGDPDGANGCYACWNAKYPIPVPLVQIQS